MDNYSGAICYSCGCKFTNEEWDMRHSDITGEDVHEDCCEICHKLADNSEFLRR